MANFFTPNDPLDKIIAKTFPDKKIEKTEHILTGWTNIVIEATTSDGISFVFHATRFGLK